MWSPKLCWKRQDWVLRATMSLQAILLLAPAFLLIGWGHTLPVLGLGLLLYSFGEWACQGQGLWWGPGGHKYLQVLSALSSLG